MNIIKYELKFHKNTFVLWTIILLLIFIIYMLIYPIYKSNQEVITDILNNMPKEVQIGLNMNPDTIFTPLGYYSFMFNYVTIIAAFEAAILGLRAMKYDQMEHANSFILTKPLSRKNIYTYKLISALVFVTLTNIIYQIVVIVGMLIIKGDVEINFYHLFLINLGLYFIQLTFISISMMIGAFIKKTKTLTITSIVIIFVFFILSIVENALDIPFLRYLNPFSYFKISDVLLNGGYKASFITATIFLTFFCISFSYNHYANIDIT